MRHFRFCQFVWLMLVVILLQTAAALTLPGSSPPQSGNSTPAFAQSQLDSNDSCCEEISFVSQELSLRCEGQSKQGSALIRSFTLLAVAQQRDDSLRAAAPAPVFLPVRFFLPRKLSPRSAQDDSFLS